MPVLYSKNSKKFANKTEIDNVVIFANNEAYGINLDKKEFQKLLNLVKSDKVPTLIVKDMSRLEKNIWKSEI